MDIPNKNDFQPIRETLNLWLGTRKPYFNVGGVQMPGFFSDSSVSSDRTWFYIALFGEFVGFTTTLYGGFSNEGAVLIFSIIIILMFILCDFVFAMKLHRNKEKICKLKTRILLSDANNIAAIRALELEIGKGKFGDFIYTFLIILIAIVKILGVYFMDIFNGAGGELIYFPFIILYSIVAYVHLKHTGYFLAYYKTQKKIENDYKNFAEGKNIAIPSRCRLTLPTKLSDTPIKFLPHEIIQDNSVSTTDNTFTYIINIKGILMDDDIVSLCNGQESHNKIEIFKACRNLQLTMV